MDPKEGTARMRRMTAAVLAIAFGGLWSGSCASTAQPPPPPDQPSADRIVVYTWTPVPRAADRLVYAIKVDRRNCDVRQVAAQLQARPPGQRVIRLWKWADPDLTRHPADCCRRPDGQRTAYWYPQPSAGVDLVRARWRMFLAGLREHGAPLEEVIVDFERWYNMWGGMQGEDKAAHLRAIQNDPRFHGVTSREDGDLSTLERVLDTQYDDYLVWNAVMQGVVDAALQAAIYEPLREYYPDARCSNFGSYRMRRDLVVPTPGGGMQWLETDGFGTHDAIPAYGHLGGVSKRPLRGGRDLDKSAFAGLLYTIKRVEAADQSSPRPLKVWIAPRTMVRPRGSVLTGTPYHDELIRHLLVRRYGLILWNGEPGGDDPNELLNLNAILNECAERIGETGPALDDSTEWTDSVIESTTYHGDVVVHRFTLEHPEAGLRYRINGVEYVRHLGPGEVGLWVTHARGDDFHVVG
jgi:hypothetical protein